MKFSEDIARSKSLIRTAGGSSVLFQGDKMSSVTVKFCGHLKGHDYYEVFQYKDAGLAFGIKQFGKELGPCSFDTFDGLKDYLIEQGF